MPHNSWSPPKYDQAPTGYDKNKLGTTFSPWQQEALKKLVAGGAYTPETALDYADTSFQKQLPVNPTAPTADLRIRAEDPDLSELDRAVLTKVLAERTARENLDYHEPKGLTGTLIGGTGNWQDAKGSWHNVVDPSAPPHNLLAREAYLSNRPSKYLVEMQAHGDKMGRPDKEHPDQFWFQNQDQLLHALGKHGMAHEVWGNEGVTTAPRAIMLDAIDKKYSRGND